MKINVSVFAALILVVFIAGILVPGLTSAQNGNENEFEITEYEFSSTDGSQSYQPEFGGGVIVQTTNIPCGKTVRNGPAICDVKFICTDGNSTTKLGYQGKAKWVCGNGADVDNLVRISGFVGSDHVSEYGSGTDVISKKLVGYTISEARGYCDGLIIPAVVINQLEN